MRANQGQTGHAAILAIARGAGSFFLSEPLRPEPEMCRRAQSEVSSKRAMGAGDKMHVKQGGVLGSSTY